MESESGLTKLLSDDSPILGNIQTDVPNLLAVSRSCNAYLPFQSSRIFEQGNITFMHIDATRSALSRSSVGIALDSVWWQHMSRFQKSGVGGATGARCLSSILAGMVVVGGRP